MEWIFNDENVLGGHRRLQVSLEVLHIAFHCVHSMKSKRLLSQGLLLGIRGHKKHKSALSCFDTLAAILSNQP
jgi:hypothetical protein